jgi:hypothetical protein
MKTTDKPLISGETEIRGFIPDFDLYKIKEVRSIDISFFESEPPRIHQGVQVSVQFTYDYGDNTYLITLALDDVRQFMLPELGAYKFEFSELEIHSIQDNMIEGCRYHVEDYGRNGLRCDCWDVKYIELSLVSENLRTSQLWTAIK